MAFGEINKHAALMMLMNLTVVSALMYRISVHTMFSRCTRAALKWISLRYVSRVVLKVYVPCEFFVALFRSCESVTSPFKTEISDSDASSLFSVSFRFTEPNVVL